MINRTDQKQETQISRGQKESRYCFPDLAGSSQLHPATLTALWLHFIDFHLSSLVVKLVDPIRMDASIQTDHVDSQEILNRLIQQHLEQELRGARRHSGVVGVMKHYQQDPDAIYRLSDIGDPRFEAQILQRSSSNPSKIKAKQRAVESFVPLATKKGTGDGKGSSDKGSKSDQSLSDRICQVVWSRKASAPFVTPLGHHYHHRRSSHHSSRRGTSPNVAPMRIAFDTKPDAFGRSQSFKGWIMI